VSEELVAAMEPAYIRGSCLVFGGGSSATPAANGLVEPERAAGSQEPIKLPTPREFDDATTAVMDTCTTAGSEVEACTWGSGTDQRVDMFWGQFGNMDQADGWDWSWHQNVQAPYTVPMHDLLPPPGLDTLRLPDELPSPHLEDDALQNKLLATPGINCLEGMMSPMPLAAARAHSAESTASGGTMGSLETVASADFAGCLWSPVDASQGPVSPPSLAARTVVRVEGEPGGPLHVEWTVDARKLRGSDKVAVSPPWELPFTSGQFRIMLCPKATHDRKGGASFRKAKGKGSVHLKSEAKPEEAPAGVITMWISVGGGTTGAPRSSPRGPVQHNFADNGVAGLAKDLEEWDFSAAVDEASQTFLVSLEIVSLGAYR